MVSSFLLVDDSGFDDGVGLVDGAGLDDGAEIVVLSEPLEPPLGGDLQLPVLTDDG